jgi:hypothetical protein
LLMYSIFLALESDATGIDLDFKPFDTHVSSDMSAAWKTTGFGGGAQGNVQFCACRPVRSSRMHLPRDERCPGCFEMYHQDFVNPAAMDVYTDCMNESTADIEKDVDYPNVCAHSNIKHSDPLVATESELNPHSIDFERDEGDLNECAAFEDLISEELDLCMMDTTGDMDETREHFRE